MTSQATPVRDDGRRLARQPAKDRRRSEILDHAAALFDAQGYSGTTTQDIADAAKITKRTLYRYMPSKEDILFEIHSRFINDRIGLDEVPSEGVVKDVAWFIRQHIRVVVNHRQEIRVFFEEMKHLSSEKRTEILAKRTAYEKGFVDLLRAGAQSGDLAIADPEVTARLVLGSLTEIYRWYRPDGPLSAEQLEEVMVSLVLDGIAVEHWEPTDPGPADLPAIRQPEEILGQPLASIWRAAVELLSARGYQTSATHEVAEAAGVTKGALFYHVRHKEEVLNLVTSTSSDEALRVMREVRTDRGSAADVLSAMARAHCVWLDTYRGASAVASEETKYLAPEHLAELTRRQDEYSALFREAFVRGQHREEFGFTDPRLPSALLVGMLNSIYRWYRPGGKLAATRVGTMAVATVLNGIRRR